MIREREVLCTNPARRCRESANRSPLCLSHPSKRWADGGYENNSDGSNSMPNRTKILCPDASDLSSGDHGDSRDSFDGLQNSSVASVTILTPEVSVPKSKLRRMKDEISLPPAFNLKAVESTTEMDMADSCVCSAATCHPISRINDFLFVGSWKDSQDPNILEDYGITYVLSIAAEHNPDDILENNPNVVNKWIPLRDSHNQNITHILEEAFNFIECARKNHSKALVHCRRGISRSPAIVIAYLMATEGLPFEAALDLMAERRPCISLNLGFQECLSEYVPDKRWLHTSEEEPFSPTLRKGNCAPAFGDDTDSD